MVLADQATTYSASVSLARVRLAFLLAATMLVARPASATAQSYYGLAGGRPGRIGDAAPTPRGTLELEVLPVRF